MRTAVLGTAVLVLASGAPALAHDPGLSSLELRISSEAIVAILSLAQAEARTLDDPPGGGLEAVTLQSIELRVDGARLNGRFERRASDAGSGSRIVLLFEHAGGGRLTVRSSLPARLPPGHRQLVSVLRPGDRLVAERMLDARNDTIEIELELLSSGGGAAQFGSLGVRHILGGYDHLLFVCALLLGVRRLSVAVRTITAFTVAHSITLALAAMGVANAPSSVIEPLIAASIVFVGLENLVRTDVGSRWPLTFAFGLVHGFGFASALQDIGIGSRAAEMLAPLAWFNLGVEAGQIVVAALLWPLARLLSAPTALRWRVACSVMIVAAGAYWLIERTVS